MNDERLIKIIEDLEECKSDINECLEVLEKYKEDQLITKLAKSSLRQLFVGFHTILEDFCSIALREIRRFKIGISLSDSFKLLRKSDVIDERTYLFLEKSRLVRNRISHRYKEPSHEELLEHIVNNTDKIDIIINIAKKFLRKYS
ncbi:HepT-like ribonuclease domain-containing protein [Clostridium manihotivorum]|uniref:DUF86 domain-containing protein n=1 Tax=Clostridium manihotivorum TaxID=2320868 RepID=A0A3R5U6Q3_9CLOT|nr:HepT-like ribonuclease domain-containing protein [Clostridium manihotivorum]QAA33317.1 hypothetical protein C1I91_17615 [Clostridium manihotivorum]